MAYTNETTHFGIPLPLGSDLTTPMDYNESMQDVDTALFEAQTDSGSALQKANQLQLDLATTNDNVTNVTGRVTTLEGTATTQGQAIIQNAQDIADVRADALDMIVAKDEGTAQVATVAVATDEYFRYNDVLYIATSDIAIGDTIVPNENCSATNVGTELSQLNSDLATQYTTTPIIIGKWGNYDVKRVSFSGSLTFGGGTGRHVAVADLSSILTRSTRPISVKGFYNFTDTASRDEIIVIGSSHMGSDGLMNNAAMLRSIDANSGYSLNIETYTSESINQFTGHYDVTIEYIDMN